ncbi:MAG: endonuclease domain-containing protein [Pseudomonadota bacterium]
MMTNRLTPGARGLRQVGGLAEDRIWARLRGGAVDGWKVRRQHPVGRFVVDFACVPLRLVIEIDGGVHERDEVVLNDHYRQQAIEALGWTVIRFTNAEALADPGPRRLIKAFLNPWLEARDGTENASRR